MPAATEVLLVAGSAPMQAALKACVEQGFPGLPMETAASERDLRAAIERGPAKVVLAALSGGGPTLEEIAQIFSDAGIDARIVVVTEAGAARDIVGTMTRGARDVVSLQDPMHLQLVVARELDQLPAWRAKNLQRLRTPPPPPSLPRDDEPAIELRGDTVERCSTGFSALLGLATPSQLERRSFYAFVDGDDRVPFRRAVLTCITGGAPPPQTIHLVLPGAHRLALELTLTRNPVDTQLVHIAARRVAERRTTHAVGAARPLSTEMVKRVRAAVEGGKLAIAVQPISALASTEGAETHRLDVLVRIRDDLGEVAAGDFLPEASSAGLLRAIDEWVVGSACALAGKNAAKGDVLLFLRLSRQSLQHPDTLRFIRAAMQQHKVSARHLSFEVTEMELEALHEAELLALQTLKKANCKLTVSQFGGRPGSLALLDKLPVDYLKLNVKLTERITQDDAARDTLRKIVARAVISQICTVSTHVADAVTLAELWKIGVNFVQGHYVQEPEIVVQAHASE